MDLNYWLLEKFKNTDSKLLAVTKYLETKETDELKEKLKDYSDILIWFWENRLESLSEKCLDREFVHFIWNIQSKKIKDIIKYASYIHSLDDIKHLKKLENICFKSWKWVKVFLQINVDDTKDWWIKIEQIPEFLEVVWDMENVSLVWFSAIWKSEFTKEEKEAEFDLLLKLKSKYLPNWLISAWTSKDYEIALEKGIDIIRIGNKLYK